MKALGDVLPGRTRAAAGGIGRADALRPRRSRPAFATPPGRRRNLPRRGLTKSSASPPRPPSHQLETVDAVQSLGFLGERLLTLPRTTVSNLHDRVESLRAWQSSLQKGVLPSCSIGTPEGESESGPGATEAASLAWPEEPFQSQLVEALAELEMASLTRRYPKLANTLLNNIMDLVETFEASYVDPHAENEDEEDEKSDAGALPPRSQAVPDSSDENSEEEVIPLEDAAPDPNSTLVEDLMSEFRKEWEPIADALDASDQFFEDLGDMVADQMSHDIKTLSTQDSVWKHVGWKEIRDLSRKLERLPQLRKLVRDLGRGSRGRGPKRLANAEEYRSGNPDGLVTSNLVIEETAGVHRSGEIMTMLPSEASLLAAGRTNATLKQLWHSKRAERSLLSYERVGWMEDEPSHVLDRMEIRPSGVQGPIILCLDTSSSMSGQRERVAKALVLECIRGAKQQSRKCYLIAFSGRNEVKELELSASAKAEAMSPLLDFLQGGFEGGTDINEPIARSIDLLNQKDQEWSNADLLIVTDSEIPPLREELREKIDEKVDATDLQIHGLVVGPRRTTNFRDICTQVHIFDDWKVFDDQFDY